jgi:hypothetical protein
MTNDYFFCLYSKLDSANEISYQMDACMYVAFKQVLTSDRTRKMDAYICEGQPKGRRN